MSSITVHCWVDPMRSRLSWRCAWSENTGLKIPTLQEERKTAETGRKANQIQGDINIVLSQDCRNVEAGGSFRTSQSGKRGPGVFAPEKFSHWTLNAQAKHFDTEMHHQLQMMIKGD